MKTVLKILWNTLAVIGLISICGFTFSGIYIIKNFDGGFSQLGSKLLTKVGVKAPEVEKIFQQPSSRPPGIKLPDPGAPSWQGHGARNDRQLPPVIYYNGWKPIPLNWYRQGHATPIIIQKKGLHINVTTPKELLQVLKKVNPGDVITLAPGIYKLAAYSVTIKKGGTAQLPICVRARTLGTVRIDFDTLEGFAVNAPFWIFENLEIKGVRQDHNRGEHAFHIQGNGKSFVLRNCRIHEFNAMIKANGTRQTDGQIQYPDHALIENNSFYNTIIRRTSKSVTFIDVVAANGWIVRGNLICDFAKGQGNRISYAAFMKGNSKGGVFENNLVIGEYRTRGGTRVGLSLGGGGTGVQFARNQKLPAEHSDGIIRNNIIMYCNDVGIYLNNAAHTKIYNNTLFKTMGIDIRFKKSDATITNNLSTSRIKNRDGGKSVEKNNLILSNFSDYFKNPEMGNFSLKKRAVIVDKALALPEVFEDFCGNSRGELPDIGAMEYDGPTCNLMGIP